LPNLSALKRMWNELLDHDPTGRSSLLTPVVALLRMRVLPGAYYVWLTAILAASSVALVAGKSLYRRIFHGWL
jgi:hypothetical protein